VSADLIAKGSLFQSLGAATLNRLSAVTRPDRLSYKSLASEERSVLVGTYERTSDDR